MRFGSMDKRAGGHGRPGARRLLPAVLCCLLVVAASTPARANSADLFGLGSRNAGLGDATSAIATGPAAAYYNPAGVGHTNEALFFFSVSTYHAWLKIRDESRSIDNPYEFAVGLTVAVPFKGALKHRIWLGLLLTAHPDILGRVISRLPTEPFYPYFDNRTQRLTLLPTLAVRVLDSERWGRLTLGLGLNVFAGLEGVIVGTEGASRALEARVSEGLGGIVRANAGLRYSWRWLHLGVTYRQEFSMRFATDSFNSVAGTELNLNVDAEGLYSPHTIVAGLAIDKWKPLTLGLDVAVGLWRFYQGPYVQVSSVLPLVGELVGDLPQLNFRDSVALRLGGEYVLNLPKKLKMPLRIGLGFETSPIPDQPGRTNMLDGHKLMVSLGLGLDFGKLVGRRLWLDLHLRMHALIPRTFEKRISVPAAECPNSPAPLGPDQALLDEVPCDRTDDTTLGLQLSNPGYPRLRASGFVISGGFSIGVEL